MTGNLLVVIVFLLVQEQILRIVKSNNLPLLDPLKLSTKDALMLPKKSCGLEDYLKIWVYLNMNQLHCIVTTKVPLPWLKIQFSMQGQNTLLSNTTLLENKLKTSKFHSSIAREKTKLPIF